MSKINISKTFFDIPIGGGVTISCGDGGLSPCRLVEVTQKIYLNLVKSNPFSSKLSVFASIVLLTSYELPGFSIILYALINDVKTYILYRAKVKYAIKILCTFTKSRKSLIKQLEKMRGRILSSNNVTTEIK